MTTTEITQLSNVLAMLRQSNAMHMAGDNEQAIDVEREARVVLVMLLQANGVEDAAQEAELVYDEAIYE